MEVLSRVLSEQMQQLINHLIQVEFGSAYLYLAMSAYFARSNMTGTAAWLRLQYEEELTHAHRLVDYMSDRGGTVQIQGVPRQPVQFGSPLEAFQQVLAHEQYVTQTYQQAFEAAMKAQDLQTAGVIQEFLREQVDEVAQAMVIVGRLQVARDNPAALLIMDQELGRREPAVAPAPAPAPAG